MYSVLLIVHIIISILLGLLSCYIVSRSLFGLFGKVSFSNFQDIKLPIIIPVNYNINKYNLKNNNNITDLKLYRKTDVTNKIIASL